MTRPAGVAAGVTPAPIGQGTPVAIRGTSRTSGGSGQRRAGRGQGHRVGHGPRHARRHHHRPVPGARLDHPELGARVRRDQPSELRVPWPLRGAAAGAVRRGSGHRHGRPAPSWPATSSAAPAPTPATWPSPSAAAWPRPSATALRTRAWPRSPAYASTSPAAPTPAASTTRRHRLLRPERRAHGLSAPGYQMLLGGHVGEDQIEFGQKALRLPARNPSEIAIRLRAAGRPTGARTKPRGGLHRMRKHLRHPLRTAGAALTVVGGSIVFLRVHPAVDRIRRPASRSR